MDLYGDKSFFKKKVSYQSQKNSQKISKLNIQLIHKIFDTINISIFVLIFTLFFLSFESQRKWSNIYKTLSKTQAMNNNLVDYISKTEEYYITELESISTHKKTKPKDLIYLDIINNKKESFFKKNFRSLIEGLSDSKYQRGY